MVRAESDDQNDRNEFGRLDVEQLEVVSGGQWRPHRVRVRNSASTSSSRRRSLKLEILDENLTLDI